MSKGQEPVQPESTVIAGNTATTPSSPMSPTSPTTWWIKWGVDLLRTTVITVLVAFVALGLIVPKLLDLAQSKAVEAASVAKSAKDRADDIKKDLDTLDATAIQRAADLDGLEERLAVVKERFAPFEGEINSLFNDPAKKDRAMDVLRQISQRLDAGDPAAALLADVGKLKGRVLAGTELVGRQGEFADIHDDSWWKAEKSIEFPEGSFQRQPIVFLSVIGESFHRHDASSFAYWVRPNQPDGSTTGFKIVALVGKRPPAEFAGFRVQWIAIEPQEIMK